MNAPSPASRRSDALMAAGIGAIAGLLEGIQMSIARGAPTILAPYKVSADILWVAPALNAVWFFLAGLIATVVVRRLVPDLANRILLSVLTGLAVALNLYTLKLLYPVSVGVLTVGVVVFCWRLSPESMRGIRRTCSRVAVASPVCIAILFGVVRIERELSERRAIAKLPSPAEGATSALIILLDTVRRDRFDEPGDGSLTPHLDQFERTATWFPNAWSTTSWSLPSQASLLTGRYPHEHGADWPRLQINRAIETLPERFAAAGYQTGAFSSNSAWIVPEHLGRGFHRFRVYTLVDLMRRTLIGRALDRPLMALGWHTAGQGRPAEDLSADLLDFLDTRGSRPFFAYLCYMDVNRTFHRRQLGTPFWGTPPDKRSIVAAYDSGLSALDTEVGSLLDRLRSRGDLDRTVVVIVSDHGESFPGGVVGDHKPEGHGTSLFPEQGRVPLWIARPGSHSADTVRTDVTIRDVPATLAALTGIERSGLSGTTLLAPEASTTPDVLLILRYAGRESNALVANGRLTLEHLRSTGPSVLQVYDLTADPLAQLDQSGDSALASVMRSRLHAALRR